VTGTADTTREVTVIALAGAGTATEVRLSPSVVVAVVAAIIVALDLSASATFSAVNCGTAGIGGTAFSKVIIFG
jgi:hypothetical protein